MSKAVNMGRQQGRQALGLHNERPARPELGACLAQGRLRGRQAGAALCLAGTAVSGRGWPVQLGVGWETWPPHNKQQRKINRKCVWNWWGAGEV